MRGYRHWSAAAMAVVLLLVSPAPTASAAGPEPGGRILYLQFDGSTGVYGALKSVRPNGLDGQDFAMQLGFGASPDYSPDGNRIAYIQGYSLRTMASDGTDDRWLVDAPYGPAYPRWSPDGQWVVAESGGDIVAVHREGYPSGWVNLTETHGNNDLIAAWAPDGRHFATAVYPGIRVYSADGVDMRSLNEMPGAYRLDWSPNGRVIAIEALGDLWLVNAVSGTVRRLTNTPDVQEISPVWSPDGRWLAYGQGPGVHDPELPGLTTDPMIWLMDANGHNRHSTGVHGLPSSWRAAA
ncbi:TolB protein [Hamadaea flava]|uniref:TolB protein n=1 Tax=Hamadaea flava TaxID=1742688 RepID=A0ABV8LLP2_9ACTN|nr:hypothetical protein [Hamadaea flava]MCP2329648.1 TolB protein [Hamadaea flava]